ncbi:MAG: UvrD-helicase domain-containing protein [Bryobacteraceae bacterium]
MTPVFAVSDAEERLRALDPERSFIVQAPAGSGKTELLTQRYLKLLSRVSAPEEILAITFTRKSAAEMRNRIVKALEIARQNRAPEQAHGRMTWMLARDVLARDREAGWNLTANPARLRIQTIDSLSAALTRQMPLLARFGAQPETTDKPEDLYREAARNTLAMLEDGERYGAALECLLRHLDNHTPKLEELLVGMLGRRDQWLRHVVADSQREALERDLRKTIVSALAEVQRGAPEEARREITELAAAAADTLAALKQASAINACLDMFALPGETLDDRERWLGIAEMVLTVKGRIRKAVDKRTGFRPENRAEKQRCLALLQTLSAPEYAAWLNKLHALRRLPPESYKDNQWEVLEALFTLLPVAVAQLTLVFRERGKVDFSEVAQAAALALGSPENPTDLALSLDCRLQHLLVDEFQDTSLTQYELLERLTAGWTAGDGRTFFAVGDPMQSIYRFREADVGLFLAARSQGIGALRPEPVALRVNFRSRQGIVSWVNESFPLIFPNEEDLAGGAVPFSKSEAFHPAVEEPAVEVHPFLANDAQAEAAQVAELVREARERDPEGTIAILVRARTHLSQIALALEEQRLAFQAVDIEQLGERPAIQDLLALTRALLHPADRVAWLAVLRAPWCGLTLADLHSLAAERHDTAVWELLRDAACIERLSGDGRARAGRLAATFDTALSERGRRPLRRCVEGVWLALGGPACLPSESDLEDANAFFALLEELEEGGDLLDFDRLSRRVEALFAAPNAGAGDSLQLLTMHKAKGLEFDTVILPGLGRQPRHDDPKLLAWIERRGCLLLAPARETGKERDPLGEYIRWLEKERATNEEGRLLYVAATRAKKRLHLLGHTTFDGQKGVIREPDAGSLLRRLWPVVRDEFGRAERPPEVAQAEEVAPSPGVIRRIPGGWVPPAPPEAVPVTRGQLRETAPDKPVEVEFRWAGQTVRHVGTVVHRMLQRISEEGLDKWSVERLADRRPVVEASLRSLGVPLAGLEHAVSKVERALRCALDDSFGRWVLDSQREDVRSEHALSGVVDGRVQRIIADRTFVADGVRWIVDFKTGEHEGGDLEGFLDNERERYRRQLEAYARMFARIDAHPIRLALYFPLYRARREWTPEAGQPAASSASVIR